MTIVEYHNHSYHLNIVNIHGDEDVDVAAKFDTGAVVTFFTLSALYYDIDADKALRLENGIRSKSGILTGQFRSASGADMFAVKCHKDNVTIGNIHFDKFYYWLAPSIENNKALLGDDFVAFCDFSHKFQDDIVIRDFDFQSYEDSHADRRAAGNILMSSEEIEELIFSP